MADDPQDEISSFLSKTPPRNRDRVGDLIDFWADRHGVPRDLAHQIGGKESRENPDVRRSRKGAIGPMQLMPGTAKYLGVNPFKLEENVEGGVRYLKEQLDEFKGDHVLAAAAYNAGPGAVRKYGNRVPPYAETQGYVKGVGQKQPASSQAPADDIAEFLKKPPTKVVVGKSVPAEFTGEDVPQQPSQPSVTAAPTPDPSQAAALTQEPAQTPAHSDKDEVESYRTWYNSFQSLKKSQNPKDWQAALDAGEAMLAKYPGSQYAPHIQRFLDKAKSESTVINLNDFKREGRTPTVKDIRQRVARSLGFTAKEAKAYEEEQRYATQFGHQQFERPLHPDPSTPEGRNPFYEAQDEDAAVKSILSRVDDAGQVAIPALSPEAFPSAQRWLKAYRANKQAINSNDLYQEHLRALRDLSPDEKEQEAKKLSEFAELTPEQREALDLDAPGATSFHTFGRRLKQGALDLASGSSRVIAQGLQYAGATIQDFAEPSKLIKDVFGVNADPRLFAPLRPGQVAGKFLENIGESFSRSSDVASRAGGLAPGMAKDVVQGAGSSIPFLALGGLPGKLGHVAVGLMGWATQAGQVYDEAKQAGLSNHDALMAAHAGGPAGLLEMWGIGGTLDRVGRKVLAENFIRAALRESGEEATQEMVQQVLGNLVAKGFYDKNRDIFQGVGYSGLVAAIVGGTMGGGSHAVAHGVDYVNDLRTVQKYEAKMARGETFDVRSEQAHGANLEDADQHFAPKDPEAFQAYRDAVARLAARKAGVSGEEEEPGSLSVVPGQVISDKSQVTDQESQVTEEEPATAEESQSIRNQAIPNLAEQYPDLFPEAGPSAERGEPSKPKPEKRKPVLENIDGTNRHVVRSEDGRVGIVQTGEKGTVEFTEVRNPKTAKKYEGLGGLIPSTEFDSLFPTKPEGYQPGTIEEARAAFAAEHDLGSKVKGHEEPIVKGSEPTVETPSGNNNAEIKPAAPTATAGKTSTSPTIKPDTKTVQGEQPKLRRFKHKTWGILTEAADQRGVPIGHIRTVDEQGDRHTIPDPKRPSDSDDDQGPPPPPPAAVTPTGATVVDPPTVAPPTEPLSKAEELRKKLADRKKTNGKPDIAPTEAPKAPEAPPKVETPADKRQRMADELKRRLSGKKDDALEEKGPKGWTKVEGEDWISDPPAYEWRRKPGKMGRLYMNRAGARLLSLARYGDLRHSVANGVAFTAEESQRIAQEAAKLSAKIPTDSKKGRTRKAALQRLATSLRQAANDETNIVAVVNRGMASRGTIRHEEIHRTQSLLMRAFGHPLHAGLVEQIPGYHKAAEALKKIGYADDHDLLGMEAAAAIGAGQIERLGFSEDEALDFMYGYLTLVADTYGDETVAEFTSLARRYQEIYDEVRTRGERSTGAEGGGRQTAGNYGKVPEGRQGQRGSPEGTRKGSSSPKEALEEIGDTQADYDAVKMDPGIKDLLLEISKSFIDEGNTDLDELITAFESLLGDEFDKVSDHLPTILAHAEHLAAQPKAPPEKIDLTPKTPTTLGRPSRVKTSTGMEARTQFALVEVGDPIASHGMDMHPNPHFPAGVQNRDRTRIGSEQHILDMIRLFEPEHLGKNIDAGGGAPIVGPDMAVESGNGRTIMLRRIYREYSERAKQYREWLRENSEDFGFTADQVDALKQPMLIQMRTTQFSPAERIAFAESANADTKLKMSPIEIAQQDGRRLGSSMMSIFYPDDEGNIDTAANRPFIAAFLDQIAGPDKGELITSAGLLNQEGITRIRNAIFAKAYADTQEGSQVLEMLAETTDANIKRTIAAMTFQAQRFAKLKEDIAAGARFPLDLAPDLAIAARHLSILRKSGHTIEEYLGQMGLFGDSMDRVQKKLFWVLNDNKSSAKALNRILTNYLDAVEALGDPRQASMFLQRGAPTKEEVLEEAVKEAKHGEGDQGGLFGDAPTEAIGGEKSVLFEDQSPAGEPPTQAPAGDAGVRAPTPEAVPIEEPPTAEAPTEEPPAESVDQPPTIAPIEPPVEQPPAVSTGGGTRTGKPPKKRKTKAPEQGVSDESESGTGGTGDDLGGVDGPSTRQSGRIITARSHLTKRGTESLVPERLRGFLDPHQIQGVAVALEAMGKTDNKMFTGGFLLADGTGAGKTRQILAVASTYAERGNPVLIIAPNETLKPEWEKGKVTGSYDSDARAMGIPYTLAQGKGLIKAGGITVTTYHRFHELDIAPGTILILDEGHALKNSDSQRSKRGQELIRQAEAVLYATATPQDKPTHLEYLSRAGILENKSLEAAMKDLGLIRRKSADGQTTAWVINPKVGEPTVIKRIERLFDRMTNRGQMIKRELSLEGVKITFHRVTLSPEAKATMDAIDKGFGGLKKAGGMKKANILMHMRRQQETYKIDLVAKRVKQAIDAGRRPIVYLSRINYSEAGRDIYQYVGGVKVKVGREVYASSEGTAPELKKALARYGVTSVAELHGGSETSGAEAVAAFQSGKAQAMIATIESGGTGINLDDTVGDAPRTLIIMTAPFTAVHNVQTAGRVWRLSSQSHPEIEYVFSDLPIDDWNANIIEKKMKSLGASVGGEVTKLDVPENFIEQDTAPIPGLEDIEELESLAATAPGEEEESFGAIGRKSLTRAKAKTQAAGPIEDFKVSARARKILSELGVPSAEKYLSKKYLGVYNLRSRSIRVQSSFDVFTVAHEGTHFISHNHGIIQKMINDTSGAAPFQSDQVRKDLTQLYLEYYPNASPSHALRLRMEEGFAMLVEQYMFDPADINAKYPALVKDFIKPGGLYYHPDTTRLLDAMNSLVDDYAQMTPEQRIGARIADGESVTKKDSGFDAKQRAIYEGVNQYEPLKRAGKIAGVQGTMADPFVHSFTRMALPSIVHSWIKGKNTLVLQPNGNWHQAAGTVKDYLKLIEGKEKEFDILLVARRVVADTNRMEELKKELRNMLRADPKAAQDPAFQQIVEQVRQIHAMLVKDDFKLQDATAVVGKYEAPFAEALEIYDRINKRLVSFAENTGIITPEYADQMRSSDGYSSWIRNINDELKPQGPGLTGSKNPLSKVRSFKTRTGSSLDIISPTYNQITAIGEVLGKGLENTIWRKVYDLTLKNPEIARRFLLIDTERAVDSRGKIVYPQDRDPNLIKVWIDGKRAYFKPAPEFMAVAKNLRGKELDTFANLIRVPSAVFTRLTTSANPIWALGNLTIDQFSATMNTKTGFKPVVDPVKSLVEFIREIRVSKKGLGLSGTGQFEKYLELGGRRQQFASQYEISPEDAVASVLKHKTKLQRAGGVVDLGLSALELPSNLSEYLTRFSEFSRAKKAGMSDVEAMFLASEVTTPFQLRGHMGGNFGQAWIGSLPYVNAQSQVLYKFARQVGENPGRVATVAAGLIAAALGSAIAAFRYADDEQKRELFNLEARELAKAIFIPSPLGKKLIRIRVPEEVGALTGLVYLFVGQHYGGNKVRFNDYMDSLSSPMPAPLDFGSPSRIIPGLVPQALLPTVQTLFNTRTYPEISPIVPESLKRKPVEQQYTAYTSTVARKIGGVLGVSPISVEFWIKSQFGAVGSMFLGKLPQSPLTRQEEGFQMAGRAYKNFYRDREFYDKQYQRLNVDNAFSPEEQARIVEQHAMYEDVADTFATMRKALQSKGTLPEEVKKQAFDVLMGLDRGKAGMPADADALKQTIGVLSGEKGPQPQRHRLIGERIRGVVESDAYKQLPKDEKRDVLRDIIKAARDEDTEGVKLEKPTRKPVEQAVVEQEVRTARTRALFDAATNAEYKKLSGWQQKWVRDQVSGMFDSLRIPDPEVSQDIRSALKELVPEVKAAIPDLIANAKEIEREAIRAAR